MTEATFQYTTSQDVDCSFCLPADIILCVTDGLLLFGNTLEAQITTKTKGATSCSGIEYSYTISYDSDLLADPDIVLNGCHVAGLICKNCFTTYIENKISYVQGYVPVSDGTPVTAPTAQTGFAPLVVDTTNNKLYFYSNGAWRDAGP